MRQNKEQEHGFDSIKTHRALGEASGAIPRNMPGPIPMTIMGIGDILVHALLDDAKRFRERHGFTPGANRPMMLNLPLRGSA